MSKKKRKEKKEKKKKLSFLSTKKKIFIFLSFILTFVSYYCTGRFLFQEDDVIATSLSYAILAPLFLFLYYLDSNAFNNRKGIYKIKKIIANVTFKEHGTLTFDWAMAIHMVTSMFFVFGSIYYPSKLYFEFSNHDNERRVMYFAFYTVLAFWLAAKEFQIIRKNDSNKASELSFVYTLKLSVFVLSILLLITSKIYQELGLDNLSVLKSFYEFVNIDSIVYGISVLLACDRVIKLLKDLKLL